MPKSTRQSTPEEGSDDDQLVTKVIAILNDSAVLNKMKTVLFPEKLSNEIRHLRETILSFQKKLDEKSQHIIMLETKVSGLECKLDEIEQYGRRSNLIFSGFAELPQGANFSTSRTMSWVSLPPYSQVTSNAFTDWVERRTPFDRGR